MPALLLDVTSLLQRRYEPVMTGIDRVEFSLAAWLCGEGQITHPNVGFVINTRRTRGLLDRKTMTALLAAMAKNRGIAEGSTSLLIQAQMLLTQPPSETMRVGAVRLIRPAGAYDRGVGQARLQTDFAAIGGTVRLKRFLDAYRGETHYIHASHAYLNWPHRFAWLRRWGIEATFFVHDLIPLDFPQFCSSAAHVSHHRKMATISAYGQRIAVNSAYTADRLRAYFAERRLHRPNVSVHPLGTGALPGMPDLEVCAHETPSASWPYFLCAGTIEARKNVGLLLEVWRRMMRTAAPNAMPRLVLAGGRGWHCQEVLDDLNSMTDIAGHIVEINGLNDQELFTLMDGAKAVLTPSLAEGYSLVPAEALVRGVPVVASDIPAHRELIGSAATLVDPTKPDAWNMAISHSAFIVKPVDEIFHWNGFSQGLAFMSFNG